MAHMPKDIKTRYQGVYARHRKSCRLENGGDRCNCKPSFYGVAYDRAHHKPLRTRRHPTVEAAKNARADLTAQLDRGEAPATRGLPLTDARERFVKAARDGRALNKRGRRYKPKAIDDIESSLKLHVEPTLGRRRITDIRRGDIQAIIDEMAPNLSGSRVRSVVNAIRSLYAWAQDRDLASHDPAQHVRLPAMDATPIDRVASPAEFAVLLAALDTADAVAYGLAGYAMARAAQILRVRWRDIDLDVGLVELGVEWEAAKYDASHRTVPLVPPMLSLLKRLYLEQGRPDGEQLVCPPRYQSPSGLMSTGGLAKRAKARWEAANLTGITLQESRHSAATWLDAAGVSPRVASVLMGHAVPERQDGAAAITLSRYTHALPQDIERARRHLADYLVESQSEATG
jgi:integrase